MRNIKKHCHPLKIINLATGLRQPEKDVRQMSGRKRPPSKGGRYRHRQESTSRFFANKCKHKDHTVSSDINIFNFSRLQKRSSEKRE
jgi:hypothetical protein